jgi:methyltransferase-like protein 6
VGNAVYPVLEGDARIKVHCCDFSRNAVELVKKHALYDEHRVNAFHCDITQTPLTVRDPPWR